MTKDVIGMKGELLDDLLTYSPEGKKMIVSYDKGTKVRIIGQSDGSYTLNTGGIAFCCIMPDGCIKNIQDTSIKLDVNTYDLTERSVLSNITLREYYAGLAMQGLLADPNMKSYTNVAIGAVVCADELLDELAEENSHGKETDEDKV